MTGDCHNWYCCYIYYWIWRRNGSLVRDASMIKLHIRFGFEDITTAAAVGADMGGAKQIVIAASMYL